MPQAIPPHAFGHLLMIFKKNIVMWVMHIHTYICIIYSYYRLPRRRILLKTVPPQCTIESGIADSNGLHIIIHVPAGRSHRELSSSLSFVPWLVSRLSDVQGNSLKHRSCQCGDSERVILTEKLSRAQAGVSRPMREWVQSIIYLFIFLFVL